MTAIQADIVRLLTTRPGEPRRAMYQYGLPFSDRWGYSPGPREPIIAFDKRDVERLFVTSRAASVFLA
jgi:hypothetical protein